ncbi:MAG: ferrous iron transport protein B [Prevotella sp.]|nr:ferrous iron transport protein B [Bacteroides sp.]MCM1365836.1 ferrous iron transport protein B [Prevotella sp.]MCM1436472.1 ferrous iron transport protein B [Prevotella sp.]
MRLSELKPGQNGIITKILGHGAFRKRVMEMGFVKGRDIKVLLQAPLSDPIKYRIMDYEVSLRRAEASLIEVVDMVNWDEPSSKQHDTDSHDDTAERGVREDKVINVALIGNPNCGKTSLFNNVSGAHEHVGNYAGVTVSAKEGKMRYKGYELRIVDLPGTYSLSAYSPEELYVLRYLRKETPDVIVNVVVGSNLERNLFLTTELIDMNRSMVIDLNMYDEVERSGIKFDYKLLGQLLGVPVVPTVASAGRGVNELLDKIIDVYEMRDQDVRHIHVKMNPVVEESVQELKDALKRSKNVQQHFSPRYLAVKLLEGDPEVERTLKSYPDYQNWIEIRDRGVEKIKQQLGEDPQAAISSEKYGFIQGALAECLEDSIKHEEKTTSIIDAFVTNKLFGFPIFLIAMWLMFWCTFELGSYPMEWIEQLVAWVSSIIGDNMHDGPLKDLLLDGIIGGVGGVIVFLPNILILYAFISFMEDSGYMARVAFIMDKLMHKMGLHGKSFIPLVMGFGCNVPAIMSTRIIESKSSRLITILINPYMSCSARIPIYILLAGAFFPGHGTMVMFGLYLLGIVIAVITARLLRRFWFKKDETPFVMELPPYRIPTMKATARAMWAKAVQYLRKMGGLILVASIVVWALSYFPRYSYDRIPSNYAENVRNQIKDSDKIPAEAVDELILNEYQQQYSFLGRIGKWCEPVVEPFGQNWKGCVSLMAGAAAKEVVVSTLGVLYVGEDNEEVLSERLQSPDPITGQSPFNAAKALAFMVFVLVYFPCIASIAAIVRETGSWKYGLFSVVYNTVLAWILAVITYQIATIF